MVHAHRVPSGANQDMYRVFFDGDWITTTVTSNHDVATTWINHTLYIHRRRFHSLVVGLHIEWCRNVNQHHQHNPVAILQICIGRGCLIFQLLQARPRIPLSLYFFLRNPDFTFVGVGIRRLCSRLYNGYALRVGNRADLADLAAECFEWEGLRNAGLVQLARVVIEKRYWKSLPVTLSGWDSEHLTPAQVAYACVDAFVSFEMGRFFMTNYHSDFLLLRHSYNHT